MLEIPSLALRVRDLNQSVDWWNTAMIWALVFAAIAAIAVVVTTRLALVRTKQLADTQERISEIKEAGAKVEQDRIVKELAEAVARAEGFRLKARQLEARMIPLRISKAQEVELSRRLAEIPGMVINLIAPPGPHILPHPRSGERIWLAFGLPPAKDAGWDPRLLLSNDRTELGVVVRIRRGASLSIRKIAERVVEAMLASGIAQAVIGPDFDDSETPTGSEAGPTNKWAPDANMWIVVGS